MTDIWSKIEEAVVASGHDFNGWLCETTYVGDYLPEKGTMFIEGVVDIGDLINTVLQTIKDNPEEFKKFIEGEK